MPYDIAKGFDGCAYAVVKLTPDGRELAPGGCHQTAIEAGKHLAALQAATASEVRHPGHGDQSVHNPRKGASISAKMMTPEKLAENRARTKDDMDRLADNATPADRAEAMDEYDKAAAVAVKFQEHSEKTSSLFKSESDIGGAAGEAAIKTSKAIAKEYLTINSRMRRKASAAKKEKNFGRQKAFTIAADGAGRLEFSSGLSGYLSSVRGIELILELRSEGHEPNGAMKAEARRGLEWRQEYGRGGTEIGVARARDIVNGRNLSLDTVRRMVSYFARHEVDKQGEGWSEGESGYPSAGRIAWALWGGDPGRTWANAISEYESDHEHDGESDAESDNDRGADFNYELRHPGHGDQSVHNPHKGAGFVRPVAIQRTVETEMAEKFTDEEWKATAYAHRLTPEIKDDKALPSEVPTPEEVKAIQSYQYGSGKFQQSLLNPETEPDSLGEVKALRGVLERNSLQEDTTLYRGIGGAVGNSQMAAKLREAGVGGVVQSDRFVSSAANSRVASAFGEADLVIKAPAGTKGAYLDRIIYAEPSYASVRKYDVQAARKIAIPGRGEAEFVMPPGVKFRVDSIGQNQANGRTVFEVAVVP
jgi:hypothetical protein